MDNEMNLNEQEAQIQQEPEAAESIAKMSEQPMDTVSDEKKKNSDKLKNGIWTGILIVLILVLAVLVLNIFFPNIYAKIFNSNPYNRKAGSTVVTIGDYEIKTDEFTYYVMPVRVQNEATDPTYWKTNPDVSEKLKDEVVQYLRQNYAVLQWAKEEGIELSEQELADIDTEIANARASFGSDEEYQAMLDSSYLTEALQKKLYTNAVIVNKFIESVYKDQEFSSVNDEEAKQYAADNNYYAAKHIVFIKSEDEELNAQKLETLQGILQQLKDGADFDTLMNEYSEDTGLAQYPNGYTFSLGTMVEGFEDAVTSLEINEMSDIVTTELGYHIILRIEPDYDAFKDSIISDRITAKIQEYKEKMDVNYAFGYSKFNVADIEFISKPVTTTAEPSEEKDAA